MARAMAEDAIMDPHFVEQVRQAKRAVSAGVEPEHVYRLGNVALGCVVAVPFVIAMGDVEIRVLLELSGEFSLAGVRGPESRRRSF